MTAKRFTVKRIIFALLTLGLIGLFSYIPYLRGDYFVALDRYSGDISRGDETAAKEDFRRLKYFYELHEKLDSLYLGWVLGDLLQDTKFHHAALSYISRDYGGVIKELEAEEGFWAYYMRANALWRQSQDMFARGLSLSDPIKKKEQLKKADEIAKTTKDDYAAAIKSDPNDTHEPKWNYDITTDDAARMRALMPKPGQIKVKLGVPGPGGSGPGPEGKDKDGKKGEKPKDLDKKGEDQRGKAEGQRRRAG